MNEQLTAWITRVRACIRSGHSADCPLCQGGGLKPGVRRVAGESEGRAEDAEGATP